MAFDFDFAGAAARATPASGRLDAGAALRAAAAPGALAAAAALSGARRGPVLGIRAPGAAALRSARDILLDAFYGAGTRVGLVLDPPAFCRHCDAITNVRLSSRLAPGGLRGGDRSSGGDFGGGVGGERGGGGKKSEVEERVVESMTAFGVGRIWRVFPDKMSAQNQKRLAFACALALCPDVFVIERATAGLDKTESSAILSLIRREVKIAAIVLSENFDELEYLCSWVLVADGELVFARLIERAGALARSPSMAAFVESLSARAAAPKI